MLSLVSFSVTVAIMLACATVVYLERKQPDMRALGTIFFVQFFAGAIFDHIFDLLYVGTSLIQVSRKYSLVLKDDGAGNLCTCPSKRLASPEWRRP